MLAEVDSPAFRMKQVCHPRNNSKDFHASEKGLFLHRFLMLQEIRLFFAYSGAFALEGSDAFVLKPSQPPSIETEMILIGGEIFKNRTGTFTPCPTPDLPWLSQVTSHP